MVELIDLSWKDEYVTFDSQDTKYKSIFGAVPCNQSVTFNIEINKNAMINCVDAHFFVDNLDVSKPAVHCAYEMKPVDNLEVKIIKLILIHIRQEHCQDLFFTILSITKKW